MARNAITAQTMGESYIVVNGISYTQKEYKKMLREKGVIKPKKKAKKQTTDIQYDAMDIKALVDGVNVDLSGVAGYGSSFLEEVFGGLVRKWDGTKDELSSKLHVIATDPRKECYRLRVEKYMSDAWNCKNGNA